MKTITFLFVAIELFLHCNLKAADKTIKIEDYSYKEGLTTSGVTSVFKDSKGFIWLCTNNGLFRYDGYSFRNVNTLVNDKLNLRTISIAEDDCHNFLIGTVSGMYYYDTQREKIFPIRLQNIEPSIVNRIILINRKVYAATRNGLVVFQLPKTINADNLLQARSFLPDSLHKRTFQDNIINTLYYIPGSSSLWVGTNSLLYEFDLNKQVASPIQSHFQNSIRDITLYKNHILASSWDGGIFAVNPATHRMENDDFIREVNKVLGLKRTMSAALDNENRLWVATYGNGLYIFERSKSGILTYVNYRNNSLQQENLKSDFINQLLIDNNGVAWLSMNQPALVKIYFQENKLRYFNFFDKAATDQSKEILAFCPSTNNNNLWINTNGGGIYLFDTQKNSFRQFTDKSNSGLRLQSNDISLCYQDKSGNLWIVYQRIGLYVVPGKIARALLSGEIKAPVKPLNINKLLPATFVTNSYITSFLEDSKGRLWIGGWGSLFIVSIRSDAANTNSDNDFLAQCNTTSVYSDNTRSSSKFPISPVVSITEINSSTYWLGTIDAGIIEFTETAEGSFEGKQQKINAKLPSINIKCIVKDKNNHLWIGTNAGLCYLNSKTGKLTTITTKDGLSSDNINNIAEDKYGNIWVSTSYGISGIDSKRLSILNYFHPDKESYNQYISNASSVTSQGIICFSTNEAIVMFDPNTAAKMQKSSPLYFTDIKINNNTIIPYEKFKGTTILKANINDSKTINVPYGNTLSIEFAALDFAAAERITYKYKIGSKAEWIVLNPGQRSLTLPNMSPGEYILRISTANADIKTNIREIRINYLPPFWRTTAAYIVYIIIILTLLLTYRKLLIQRILQKSIIEKERFERKKLEELDKMKSEFFSNISHEFRTPLSLIVNPLEKLSSEPDISEKNQNKIKLILKNSNRLLKLTNELMDFSKIENELLVPDFQLCEIISIVRESCQSFNNMAETLNLDFKINASFDHLEIPVDKGMIEKVIFNLLSNAFKYTPSNGMIMVNVSKYQDVGKEQVKISVVNTGKGIDKENLTRIFDRYYQVNNVQNRHTEGTGIGLALVKSFVELHHGKIEVKSEPNLETCFDVYLPIVQENVTIQQDTQNQIDTETAANNLTEINVGSTSPLYRVLVIEDEEDIRNYIADELLQDFQILSATNGKEGLNIANKVIPDLIITDVMMPVMSGFDLCKTLKSNVITSHIPVIMLSARTNIETQIEGLETGADVYMVKPFNIDHLKAQILRLINFKQTIHSRYQNETTLIPQGSFTTKIDEEFMKKVMNFIEKNLINSDLNVDQLAQYLALSKVQTYRKIKAISGMSIVEFIRSIRLKKAAQMIREGQLNISEIAFETGFSTPSYFSKCFHDQFGKTPSEYATSNDPR
ncbi:MAG TPA: two-component regulator propeller domain-containing protein [Bacteroidales bacterium]|nr:two-component regulator propeller domain-containing protein [Bacteroidales bacterium]